MKRIWMMATFCCLSYLSAQALVVSVDNYGDITSDTTSITLREAPIDPMTGLPTMGISGVVIANGTLSVSITRSGANLDDEFCCAGNCQAGNGETQQTYSYSIQGLQTWYTHYRPFSGSGETITYRFEDSDAQCTIIVHYLYDAQGLDEVPTDPSPCTKIIENGILYIIKDNHKYTIL